MAYAGKSSGVQGYGWPRRWSRGGAPPPGHRKIFENLQKKFLKKIAKNALFWPIFQRKFKNPPLDFRAFGRKTIGWENFEKILKFFDENSIEKLNFYLFWGKISC